MSSLGVSSSSSSMFGAHRDVLDAKPDSEGATMSLLEELKRRGRSAVGSRAYPDARALYSKAIEIFPENGDSRDKAILYSNRSLCELQMNQLANARDDAEMATVIDPSYLKGFWRLGSAHAARSKETALALKAFQSALALDPKNGALQKEVRKMETRLKKELEEEKNKPKEEASASIPAPPRKTTSVVKKTSSVKNHDTKKSTDTVMMDDDDENIFTASDKIRGYKIVGGKKTSFFHHEQTEEEKRLIGDIAPKRIETPTVAQGSETEEKKTDGSAWNKAGTWEERDVTAWAVQTITESLLNCQYQLPAEIMTSSGEGLAKVTKVTKLKSHTEGGTAHASYASVRGKKRYIYEFCITLNWELSLPGDDKASGTMSFPDVDGTCELGDGYDLVEFTVNRDESTASTRPLVEKFVRNGGLRNVIHDAIDDWVRSFRSTY